MLGDVCVCVFVYIQARASGGQIVVVKGSVKGGSQMHMYLETQSVSTP